MEGHTQGHIKRNNETFYFVCPKSAIFVPDTQKYPSSRLIHLRYVTKDSSKNKEKTLDYIGRQIMQKTDIGIIGLAVMGRSLALDMADHGFPSSAVITEAEK